MFFERGAEPGEKFPCPVAGSFGELIEIVLLVRGDEDDVVAAVGVRRGKRRRGRASAVDSGAFAEPPQPDVTMVTAIAAAKTRFFAFMIRPSFLSST